MLPRNSWVVYSVKRNNSFSKILYELKNERKRKIKNEIILIQINSCMEEKKKEIKQFFLFNNKKYAKKENKINEFKKPTVAVNNNNTNVKSGKLIKNYFSRL